MPRIPDVLYLAPTGKPDLWRNSTDGSAPQQLTFTGGGVYDYGVSDDGTRIAYSARNHKGGLDIWEIGRDGNTPRLLLPCQVDWCFDTAYSPDGRLIAYSRRQIMSMLSATPSNPRIWLLDTVSLSTEVLLNNPNIEGIEADWSPDGIFLSYFDGKSMGIQVTELATRQHFFFPAATGVNGSWSSDSRLILYADTEDSELGPVGSLKMAEIQSRVVSKFSSEENEQLEYGAPEWSPDGQVVAVSLWQVQGSAGKQIYIFSKDGVKRAIVTQDQLLSNTSYHWSPAGDQLVFQRFALGSSDNKPWVVVWNWENGSLATVAEDAFQPEWLP